MKEAMYYEKKGDGTVQCHLCPHECLVHDGGKGFCRVRGNHGGILYSENYEAVSSIALDPIEKKPLRRFYPGSRILSVGSFGCSFCCSFCQNHDIAAGNPVVATIAPEELVERAVSLIPKGNIGIAYTYNEPLIGYEYVLDCAKLARPHGLKNVVVTNGYISEEPLLQLLPYIDAMNIDLKSFSDSFYRKLNGNLEAVKRTISLASKACNVEVTTLIIPDENDSVGEIGDLAMWLASIDKDIPLHISAFFPRYKMLEKAPTSAQTVFALAAIARRHLTYVYEGNV